MANGIFGAAQRMGGIFGSRGGQQTPEEPPKKRGFMDVLAEIFTGASDPRLNEQQAERARRDALITAGLTTMAAGGQTGLDRVSLLQAIAGGAAAGRQAGDVSRRSAVIGELAGGDPNTALPQFRQMFVEALQAGDADGARSIATVINAMEAAQSRAVTAQGESPYIFRTVGNELLTIDRRSGELVSRTKGQSTSRTGTPTIVQKPDGTRTTAVYDRDLYGFREMGTGLPIPGAMLPDDQGIDPYIAQIAPTAVRVLGEDIRIMQELDVPNVIEAAIDDNDLLRWLAPEDVQRFRAAGDDAVTILALIRSGRQVSFREMQMLKKALIPRPGDSKQTAQDKLNRIQAQLDVLQEVVDEGRAPTADDILPNISGAIDTVLGSPGETPIFDEFKNRQRP